MGEEGNELLRHRGIHVKAAKPKIYLAFNEADTFEKLKHAHVHTNEITKIQVFITHFH